MLRKLSVYIFIGTISFIVDISKNRAEYDFCNKMMYPILWFHHVCHTFIHFGAFSGDKDVLRLYLLASICYLLLWKIFNDECVLTLIVRKLCKRSDGYKLHYISRYLDFGRGGKDNNDKLRKGDEEYPFLATRRAQKGYIALGLFFVMYKLYCW